MDLKEALLRDDILRILAAVKSGDTISDADILSRISDRPNLNRQVLLATIEQIQDDEYCRIERTKDSSACWITDKGQKFLLNNGYSELFVEEKRQSIVDRAQRLQESRKTLLEIENLEEELKERRKTRKLSWIAIFIAACAFLFEAVRFILTTWVLN